MDAVTQNYSDILSVPQINERLVDRIKGKFPPTREQSFIRDILYGREIDEIESWVQKEYPDDHFIYELSLADMAFMWLNNQSKDWLNTHQKTIEACWLECQDRASEEKKECYDRIKSLIDTTRTGLSIDFLYGQIKELVNMSEEEFDAVLTVDTFLLVAKLEESESAINLNAPHWKQLDEQCTRFPSLFAVQLYMTRKVNPKRCLQVLWSLRDIWDDINYKQQVNIDRVRSYFIAYLRQSLYFFFNQGGEEPYKEYGAFTRSIEEVAWISGLLSEVFNSPSFEDIRAELERISTHTENKLDHQNKIKFLGI